MPSIENTFKWLSEESTRLLLLRHDALEADEASLRDDWAEHQRSGTGFDPEIVSILETWSFGDDFCTWHKQLEDFIQRLLNICESDVIGSGPRAPSSPAWVQHKDRYWRGNKHSWHIRFQKTIEAANCPLWMDLGGRMLSTEFNNARILRNWASRTGIPETPELVMDHLRWLKQLDLKYMFESIMFGLERAVDTAQRKLAGEDPSPVSVEGLAGVQADPGWPRAIVTWRNWPTQPPRQPARVADGDRWLWGMRRLS